MMMLAMLLIAGASLNGCFATELESPFVSLTLWSYEGTKSQVQHFTLRSTQRCYKFSSCTLDKISFAMWSTLPSNVKMSFFKDDSCSLMYFSTRTATKSLAFNKVGVSENVTAVMLYEGMSKTVEHSTECSDLYPSGV